MEETNKNYTNKEKKNENKWDFFLEACKMFSDDFMANGRGQIIEQKREGLD